MNKIHKTGRTWQTPFGAPLLAILITLFSFGKANAQVAGYGFAPTSGTYAPITGGTVLGTPINDDTSFGSGAAFPLPFAFTYNGVACTHFAVNSNGFIALGTSAAMTIASTYDIVSGSTSNVIAGFNSDLQGTATTGELSYATVGTAPNRSLVVQWKNYSYWPQSPSNGNFDFQIRLNEGATSANNTVSMVYGAFVGMPTSTAVVGLRGVAGTDFNTRQTTTNWAATTIATATNNCSVSSTVFPASGLTYTWTPPTPSAPCSGAPAANTAVSSVTSVCAGVPFNLSLSTSYSTTGIAYQWQTASSIGGTYVSVTGATSSTYAVATQTAGTAYRCIITCSGFPIGTTSTAVFVTQNALSACYCAPTGLGSGICITNVTLGNINNNSLCEPAPNYYTAFPSTITTDLPRGASIPVGVTNNGDGIVSVWIDFNANGVFEASEWTQPYITGANATAIVNIAVPVTAVLGVTKMRVRVRFTGNANGATDGCPSGGSGEAEDYFVNIVAPTTCTTVNVTPAAGVATITTGANTITLGASGGASGATYVYGVVVGALPAGLTLTGNVISGTATGTVGTTGSFTIAATSTPNTCSGTAAYTYTITASGCTTVVVTPASSAVVFTSGTAITNITLGASGGATGATYAYAISAGALPAGLTLAAGVISGTPTTVGTGSFTVTATSTPGACIGTATYTFTVAGTCSPIVVTPASGSSVFTIGTPPNIVFNATGGPTGTPAYTFAVTGTLPTGVTVVGNATVGAPTTAQSGSFTVTATATTGTCPAGSATYLYNVTPAGGCTPALTPTLTLVPAVASANTLVSGTVGVPFSQQFTGAGVTGTYTYVLTTPTPAIPAGLTFNNATGLLSGTPTLSTSFTFRVIASAGGCPTAPNLYSLVINPSPATAIDNSLANLVKVSPNPSNGDFNVDFGTINMAKSSVRVYDAQGKVVFTSENNSNLMTISLDKFANGIYLMEVETSKGRVLKRLAKQ